MEYTPSSPLTILLSCITHGNQLCLCLLINSLLFFRTSRIRCGGWLTGDPSFRASNVRNGQRAERQHQHVWNRTDPKYYEYAVDRSKGAAQRRAAWPQIVDDEHMDARAERDDDGANRRSISHLDPAECAESSMNGGGHEAIDRGQ